MDAIIKGRNYVTCLQQPFATGPPIFCLQIGCLLAAAFLKDLVQSSDMLLFVNIYPVEINGFHKSVAAPQCQRSLGVKAKRVTSVENKGTNERPPSIFSK